MVDLKRFVVVDVRLGLELGFLFLFLLCSLVFGEGENGNQTLRLREERVGLIELRSSLGLRGKDWPIKADPCLLWKGIECEDGRVVGINISGFRRTRIGRRNPQFAVDSLVNLTSLASFNASRFVLPGEIPEWFGLRMQSLEVLDLSSCGVRGVIPVSLGNLTTLSGLHLSGNSLTGSIPLSIGQVVGLEDLDLSHNMLTGYIPGSFSLLGNLSMLDMSGNFLSGSIPPAISSLLNLQVLNLSNNSFSSSISSHLGDLRNLVDLDLSFNSLSGSLYTDLRGLRNLQRMVINNNFVSGTLPAILFSTLRKLQLVNLGHNNFSGVLPDSLLTLPQLNVLDVSSNNFTGFLTNSTVDSDSGAALFNLSGNKLYGNLTPILKRFSFVDLSGNYFEGKATQLNASFDKNCLQDVPNQKNLSECSTFYANRGLEFDNFGTPTAEPPPAKSSLKRHKKTIILAAVIGGIGVILLITLACLLFFLCCRKTGSRSPSRNQTGNGVGPVPTGGNLPPSNVAASLDLSRVGDSYTYEQLLQATSEFNDSNLVKHGHSGDLYHGVLEGGIPVVVKKIDLPSIKNDGYLIELNFFSKVSHIRMVPFLGHCLENENEKFLVYKYMRNGDLSNALFRKTNQDNDGLQSLDWITRLKIAIGAAEGLSYLHHECTPPLVHRDVQASSILLDDKFEVRLGSLGEVCAQEVDPHQSRFTRFMRLPQTSEPGPSGIPSPSTSHDVYCFGKVLLELVTGKLGISATTNDASMKDWLDQTLRHISMYDKELVTTIIDPSLIIDDDLLEEVWAVSIVARSCLNPKPSRRPLMRYILKALENPLKVVREEHSGSARLRATSSRGSWNATLFSSWRLSSSDAAAAPSYPQRLEVGASGLKKVETSGSQSQGSGTKSNGEHSSSRRRHLKDIFPEPEPELPDTEKQD